MNTIIRLSLVLVVAMMTGCAIPNSNDRKAEQVRLRMLSYESLARYPEANDWDEKRRSEFSNLVRLVFPPSQTNEIHASELIATEDDVQPEGVGAAIVVPLVAGLVVDTVKKELSKEAKRYEAQFQSVVYDESFWAHAVNSTKLTEDEEFAVWYMDEAAEISQTKVTEIYESLDRGETVFRVPNDLDIANFTPDATPELKEYKEARAKARRYKEFAAELRVGKATFKPRYAAFEIVRTAEKANTRSDGESPAFRLVVAIVPSKSDQRLFLLRPLYLEVDSAKAKVASVDEPKITIEMDIEIKGSYVNAKKQFVTSNLASNKWTFSGFKMKGDHFICSEFEDANSPHIAGWFFAPPISADKTPVGEVDDLAGGAFSIAVNITERDESKAPEYIQRAANLVGENKEKIVSEVQNSIQ